MSKGLWDDVNPDAPDAAPVYGSSPERPERPKDMDKDALGLYNMRVAEYRADTSVWSSRATRLQHLWTWVNATVDPALLAPAMMILVEQQKSTLQALIKALRTELAPTSVSTVNTVRAQYRAHLHKAKQGRMSPESWYQEWHLLYTKAKAYKLSEVEGQLATQDFLDALAPKLAPEWARMMHQMIIQSAVLGKDTLSLSEVARIYSALLQEHQLRATNHNVGIFATMGNQATEPPKQGRNRRKCPCNRDHPWPATDCRKVQSALTGKPLTISEQSKDQILARLNELDCAGLKKALAKKGWITESQEVVRASGAPSYPGSISAALIDPMLLQHDPQSLGIYTTMDFNAHPLSKSTILDNGGALHLVNSMELLEPGSYTKAVGVKCVEAGTQAFPIQGTGTRVIKNSVNGARGPRTEDLVLRDVAVVEGFHVNIISEARLMHVGVWYLGLDATLRVGTLEQSVVLATLVRKHNLTFFEYKPLTLYPTVMSVISNHQTLRSWSTHPREDSEDVWHARSGHLGPVALRALVKHARNVRIKGTARLKCEHCATTHAKQAISRRPRERSPRPYWRISWDLFDMPIGSLGELWIMAIKCDFSGKIHTYTLQAKTIIEIMRVFENFKSFLTTRYKLKICKIMQDNDVATLPWRGTSRFQAWATDAGIEIESSPPYTHEPNGGAERAGQEIITKSIKMRSSSNMPEKLWPEIVDAATWLYNMSPSYAHELQAPNTVLESWFRQYFKYYEPEIVRAATADLRPDWSGVYAYGCRAYPLNKERAAGRNKRGFKVTPRGHIGYLVGYRASNIYRIWIPTLDQVITTRNVAFDEELFYATEEATLMPIEQIEKIVNVLHEDEVRDAGEAFEDIYDQLREAAGDREESEAQQPHPERELGGEDASQSEIWAGQPNDRIEQESAPARVTSAASESPGYRAGRHEHTGLQTPELTPEPGAGLSTRLRDRDQTSSPREVHSTGEAGVLGDPGALTAQRVDNTQTVTRSGPASSAEPIETGNTQSVRGRSRRGAQTALPTRASRRIRGQDPENNPESTEGSGSYSLLYQKGSELWKGFLEEHFPSTEAANLNKELATVHAVVAAALTTQKPTYQARTHRDELPKLPRKWKELETHQLGQLFKEAAQKEINTLQAAKTWEVIERTEATDRPLPLKWVFTYKLDEDGYFVKCKARIVVRGDLQIVDSLQSTYAATLAARSFRTAMAIAAEFDLEIMQYDVVGAFLHANRDHQPTVICDLPDGFKLSGKSVKLNRALYGLRDSPLLWYEELSRTLKKAGLTASKEEPCLYFSSDRKILLLFYVDDILLIYSKDREQDAHKVTTAIRAAYRVEEKGPVSWFLNVRVIRNREKRTITLVHDEYIDKVAKKFNLASSALFPSTPLPAEELVKNDGEASKREIKDYQERVGSVLYTTIMLRPDVAFAASKLSHFLTNPSKKHFEAVDRVIVYLYRTRYQGIRYGQNEGAELMICGDASFADDTLTRRSSQGYIITLFGGAIIWKAARQSTVTTSTTEAELLALEQVSKEAMALKRLFGELTLDLGNCWRIFCDNQQTIRLVVADNERVSTKLRHVDIQNMWLRQEHAKGSFQIEYLETSSMPADGLTKNLSKQQFKKFKAQLRLVDTRSLINDQTTHGATGTYEGKGNGYH